MQEKFVRFLNAGGRFTAYQQLDLGPAPRFASVPA
jgi:hypothetical protein